MRNRKAILAGVSLLAMICAASGAALAADWKVEGKSYWIKANEFYNDDHQVHGNGTHGVIKETGYQSGIDVWYTRPSLEVWDAAVGGNKLATVWGVCMDTADFVGNARHQATLEKGWATTHVGIQHRLNGTVVDANAWARATYLAENGDWGLADPTGAAASGFQLATWELISGDGNGGANFSTGTFMAGGVTGNMLAAANGYVATGWQRPLDWTGAESWYFHNTQDFLIYAPGQHDRPPVPEIPTMLLGPIGLAVLTAIRRRVAI